FSHLSAHRNKPNIEWQHEGASKKHSIQKRSLPERKQQLERGVLLTFPSTPTCLRAGLEEAFDKHIHVPYNEFRKFTAAG
ncbi:MAG: hypothetical protein PHT95_08035, partial [Candidatus Omnitrophica bacterium]|nr:hypothetical protein [Candidatus Omnitrophota bacterium]